MEYSASKYVIVTLDDPNDYLFHGIVSGSFSDDSIEGFDRNVFAARQKNPGKYYIICKAVAAYEDVSTEFPSMTFKPIKES